MIYGGYCLHTAPFALGIDLLAETVGVIRCAGARCRRLRQDRVFDIDAGSVQPAALFLSQRLGVQQHIDRLALQQLAGQPPTSSLCRWAS